MIDIDAEIRRLQLHLHAIDPQLEIEQRQKLGDALGELAEIFGDNTPIMPPVDDLPWPDADEMARINAQNIADAKAEREARGETES